MNISDAFEGLDGSGGPAMMGLGIGIPSTKPGSLPDTISVASAYSFEQTHVETAPEPTPAPAPVMREMPKSSKELASKYDMSDNAMELTKLKTQLQKLQAENIALRASLGSMTEEEKEVQKEIGATVAEIGKLSSELTTLRAQVLAAKSALLEATAELKGHKEKKA
jgi:peptidoglycan hydrolase CwlO-like protein